MTQQQQRRQSDAAPLNTKRSTSSSSDHSKGVRLKHFETVVATLLPIIQPEYVELPRVSSFNTTLDWPFDCIPPAARVWGNLPGQLPQRIRAQRKEDQIRSILRCILSLVPDSVTKEATIHFTIVDFGGGSGHLSLPLALLLPACTVVCIDLNERSLEMLHEKAHLCCSTSDITKADKLRCVNFDAPGQKRRTAIPNLFTFHNALDMFAENFDLAVALHLCGEATDVCLRLSGRRNASAIVVAPCCVGKLSLDSKNPYIFQATRQNTPTIQYPQSSQFCQIIREQNDWNALAKAADYSDRGECRTSQNAARRTAKALLETDRRLYLEQQFGYRTAMTRMDPWESTPKNDIIVAWKERSCISNSFLNSTVDRTCQVDFQLTIDHVLKHTAFMYEIDEAYKSTMKTKDERTCRHDGPVDWTIEEEFEIHQQMTDYFAIHTQEDSVLIFPTGLGGRKRKLMHYVAEQMQLAHWSVGKKNATKTVAVARRRLHVHRVGQP
jgi:hypothetical protein